jgi:hypothetical protein
MLMCSLVPARRQAGHILVPDLEVLIAELPQRRVHVDRVPEHDDVDDKTERAQLVLLPLAIPRSSPRLRWKTARESMCRPSPPPEMVSPPSSAPSADAKPARRLITCRAGIRVPSFKCRLSGL